jgi:hypothetical protein
MTCESRGRSGSAHITAETILMFRVIPKAKEQIHSHLEIRR